MEETLNGFQKTGTWLEIVEFGEKVTEQLQNSLQKSDCDDELIEEWNEWRPKHHDELDDDVNKKTAEKAHLEEGTGEQKDRSPEGDVKRAGEQAMRAADPNDEKTPFQRWNQSLGYAKRATDTLSRRIIRRIEDIVYTRIMTRVSPYYFDNELISANISKNRDGTFRFEININIDDIRDHVQATFDEDKRVHPELSSVSELEVETSTAEDTDGI